MKYIIDRIEDNKVILEDENKKMVELKVLDNQKLKKIKEGDVIKIEIDGNITLLNEETLKRKRQIIEKTKDLWE